MATVSAFRIHPAIGIARLGNSPDSFCISPEHRGTLPIDCDPDGVPLGPDGSDTPVTRFKDEQGRIRRQAARFRIYVDDGSANPRELRIGDELDVAVGKSGQVHRVRVDDVAWTVYLANKKASWYEFQQLEGEHGYGASHRLRNASVTNTEERQKLIIDPGPRTVRHALPARRRASFSPTENGAETFPPALVPHSIASLGDLICVQNDEVNRLLVLGGFGNSGSAKSGFGNPKIEHYANNDGWFDDTSDGPVTAQLVCTTLKISGHDAPAGMTETVPVDDPAWVIVGYPRYAPELTDIVTMDDVLYDLAVRDFAYAPYIYGIAPFDGTPHAPRFEDDPGAWRAQARWNDDYRPYFERDIWPILMRPFTYGFVMDKDAMSGGDPHQIGARGNFFKADLRVPPDQTPDPVVRARRDAMRGFIYSALRKAGRENDLYPEAQHGDVRLKFAMPLLCGDNPLTNTVPSKFLRLTDTMLFLLGQWARGLFIDESTEAIDAAALAGEATALDRGVIANVLGGSFCPGGEVSWIMRNPTIYAAPYRVHHASGVQPGALSHPGVVAASNDGNAARLAGGLEPGDLTKYSGIPWQADFNECTNQPIDVTYRDWNVLEPASTGDRIAQQAHLTYWWPAHRPDIVNPAAGSGGAWSPTAATNRGDLQMVSIWSTLSFLVGVTPGDITQGITFTEPSRP